jgi:hypothetical protein
MRHFKSFAEYVEQRAADHRDDPESIASGGEPILALDGWANGGSPPSSATSCGQVAEPSLFRGLFKAVNPARPASPTSSRLLASPFRRRFKSQVVGR